GLTSATRYQRAEPATTLRATAMTSFDIRTPSDLLKKLRDEQNDFIKSHCLDARHALNAVMTAYHLHEWVWGDFAKRRSAAGSSLGLRMGEPHRERCHGSQHRRPATELKFPPDASGMLPVGLRLKAWLS